MPNIANCKMVVDLILTHSQHDCCTLREDVRIKIRNDVHRLFSLTGLTPSDKPAVIRAMLQENLPEDNYILLQYIMNFLHEISKKAEQNHMTPSNLAIVFGPNLIWPKNDQVSLSSLAPINNFTQILIEHTPVIFLKA